MSWCRYLSKSIHREKRVSTMPHNLDLTHAQWRKASRSHDTGECVEIASLSPAVAIRDSKNPNGPALQFGPTEWRSFAKRLKGDAL